MGNNHDITEDIPALRRVGFRFSSITEMMPARTECTQDILIGSSDIEVSGFESIGVACREVLSQSSQKYFLVTEIEPKSIAEVGVWHQRSLVYYLAIICKHWCVRSSYVLFHTGRFIPSGGRSDFPRQWGSCPQADEINLESIPDGDVDRAFRLHVKNSRIFCGREEVLLRTSRGMSHSCEEEMLAQNSDGAGGPPSIFLFPQHATDDDSVRVVVWTGQEEDLISR